MIVSLWIDTGNYTAFQILQQILKRQTKGLKIFAIWGSALTSFQEISHFRDGVENLMPDNPMDKAKEKANKAFNETRDSYEVVKSAAKSSFKTAGVEGEKVMDEVKKTESKAPSDLKGAAKKAGWDLK